MFQKISGYILFHSNSIIIVKLKSESFSGNLSAIFHHAKCSKSCDISSTYLPLVLHICVSEPGHHCFRQWLVAYSAPSHYLNQCWLIVNSTPGNKFQLNLNCNCIIFIHENAFENVVCQNGVYFVHGRWVIIMPADDLTQLWAFAV